MVSLDRVRIAAVVPVLHDAATLAGLIADLRSQNRPVDSIIVVSGARDAQVAALAQTDCTLIETQACRGLQLDTGARAAQAEILWFIHADARLPATACDAVIAAVEAGCAGGCLRFALQGRPTVRGRLLEWLVRLRIACGGMAYGDQALFCTRAAYQASGGFPHAPLFEEVPLVRFLRRQRGFAALSAPVFVSARRWERDGWLRRSLYNRWLALRYALGTPPDVLARAYAGSAAREPAPTRMKGTHG